MHDLILCYKSKQPREDSPNADPKSFPAKRPCLIILIAFAVSVCVIIYGCSKGDVIRITKIAATGDISSAQGMAVEKAVNYAVNPKALDRDIRQFQENFAVLIKNFRKAVEHVWGKKEAREPNPREYVKYTQNYLCRAMVDFDSGLITV
jgi:membrane-bound lytic murein transglycosylase C